MWPVYHMFKNLLEQYKPYHHEQLVDGNWKRIQQQKTKNTVTTKTSGKGSRLQTCRVYTFPKCLLMILESGLSDTCHSAKSSQQQWQTQPKKGWKKGKKAHSFLHVPEMQHKFSAWKQRGQKQNSATKKKTQQTCKKELRTKVREKEKKRINKANPFFFGRSFLLKKKPFEFGLTFASGRNARRNKEEGAWNQILFSSLRPFGKKEGRQQQQHTSAFK